ncbi:hypothetical protein RI065_08390 [Mycoplasmatota bacterium zrk1]
MILLEYKCGERVIFVKYFKVIFILTTIVLVSSCNNNPSASIISDSKNFPH